MDPERGRSLSGAGPFFYRYLSVPGPKTSRLMEFVVCVGTDKNGENRAGGGKWRSA